MTKLNSKVLARLAAAALMASVATVASAGQDSGTLTVGVDLTAGCKVVSGTIAFGSVLALGSTADQTANSGTTFKVACTTGIAPSISTSATRVMTDGTRNLTFKLSRAALGADDFPVTATPGLLGGTMDGTEKDVMVYAKILAADFKSLPASTLSAVMTVDVAY
jgi:spore coat protein U-like protein